MPDDRLIGITESEPEHCLNNFCLLAETLKLPKVA